MLDKVFGEMEYKHSWTKKDSFLFLDTAYPVNITAQAYQGDDILGSQRINYSNYKTYLAEHKSEIETELIAYCQTIGETDCTLDKCLRPETVIFERDNSWGVLFESTCDVEHGVALFIIDNKIVIGSQDLFL